MNVEINESIKRIVFQMLKKDLASRDDDCRLCALIWINELGEGESVLKALLSGSVTHPESITRTRRKLQEKLPKLRGKLYNQRHAYEEEIVNQLKIVF